jgi:hypothetical protein
MLITRITRILMGMPMMLVWLGVMRSVAVLAMRFSTIRPMIRNSTMSVEVRALITVVPVPDCTLCDPCSGIDPQAIGVA